MGWDTVVHNGKRCGRLARPLRGNLERVGKEVPDQRVVLLNQFQCHIQHGVCNRVVAVLHDHFCLAQRVSDFDHLAPNGLQLDAIGSRWQRYGYQGKFALSGVARIVAPHVVGDSQRDCMTSTNETGSKR